MIPYGRQSINQLDMDAVLEVLQSDFLTQGPKVPAFEKRVAEYTGSKFGIAVNSATSALHIACLSLGLKKGDLAWTTPNTFVASANCILYCGADIDFVDVDERTYNMCPDMLERKLESAQKLGRLPDVVIPVHFAGQSCDMKRIWQLSQKFGFKIIEDASHAIGGSYLDDKVGSCKYSNITVFSFHPVKIITTAEGGLATTNDESLAHKMALFRSHGVTRDPSLMSHEVEGDWYYEQIELGLNYRMTEIQGALGLSQMDKLTDFIEKRHSHRQRYDELLNGMPLVTPFQSSLCHSSLHLYPIRLKLSDISKSRSEVFKYLKDKGVGVNVHYIPVHTQPYYQKMGFKKGMFPESERYYDSAISLPLYQDITDDNLQYVCKVLKEGLV
ncbi:UDP-4-amino-4,6-dideoxy-N-acetyl-beta-L-altrosamine transaminase [Alteromonas mediterranea]|uniref:UDP-4-amino-4, 6-dideoxy-N-acetyl-beta-L-altrosamine transaminase n=1 Tax=Alteromonas mediterranea TaxID=314275 RepID=UPI000903B3D2|nr:UDP-4-amino-4,6-dideoxy-N-acetyl-beta-L-altrosamine transaminase [Alteromonas mediterranea]APD95387.1 UDP-4-amino-4,6-dideoxy-N-acetyl-beta-L-altrosamine transaminase [Alteromonas mediterranea]APD99020.1 UDP-4-amino-4,6-dideoxy-N-acetyl-beta-L-altrosamine transaminase [Alteromonas mediterranea]